MKAKPETKIKPMRFEVYNIALKRGIFESYHEEQCIKYAGGVPGVKVRQIKK